MKKEQKQKSNLTHELQLEITNLLLLEAARHELTPSDVLRLLSNALVDVALVHCTSVEDYPKLIESLISRIRDEAKAHFLDQILAGADLNARPKGIPTTPAADLLKAVKF